MDTASSRTVHVVDDDRGVRESLGLLLRSSGLDGVLWPGGSHLLAGLADAAPGCILLDLHMPGSDGFEILTEIRRRSADFPVIMVSAHADAAVAAMAIRAGARDFLHKPFARHTLEAALSEVCEGPYARMEAAELAACAAARLQVLEADELAVLVQMAAGHTKRMVAGALGIDDDRLDLVQDSILARLRVPSHARAFRLLLDAKPGPAIEPGFFLPRNRKDHPDHAAFRRY